MLAYIDIVGAVAMRRHNLTDHELRSIGQFTRGNITLWLSNQRRTDWVGILPVEDFHAVCGDIDIPWGTQEGKRLFQRCAV